jgi:hypothetical protein
MPSQCRDIGSERPSGYRLLILGLGALIAGASGQAWAAEAKGSVSFTGATVPITVEDNAGVGRLAAPASGGIPFPRGLLTDAALDKVALADQHGVRVDSLQKPVVLGRWGDGSVKWLLLDFLADVPANGSTRFTFGVAAQGAPAAPGITVAETATEFTVDTGKLKAVISKTRFSLLDKVWIDADGDGRYTAKEQVVAGKGEMFIDLDAAPPGEADAGDHDYPDAWHFGMEGGNWLRRSQSATANRFTASAGDYAVALYRQGATETVFKIDGWHRDEHGRQFGKYSLYIHFYAQQDTIRILHTWIMTGDPEKNFIRRMAIELPVDLPGDEYDFSFGGPFEKAGKPIILNPSLDTIPLIPVVGSASEIIAGRVKRADEAYLLSVGPDKYYHNVPASRDLRVDYAVVRNGETVSKGYQPSGWADISNGACGIAVGIRDFWHEHPKEMQYRDGRLGIYLWPDHGDRTMDLRRRYPEIRGTGEKRGGAFGKAARREFNTAGSAVGIAKTTEIFLQFHASGQKQARVDECFRGFQDPLRPRAPNEWNCATGVFGAMHPYDMAKFPREENCIDLYFAWPMLSAKEFHWYGMLDYGDHLLEYESINWELSVPENPGLFQNWGYSGWMQESYRTGQWMFLQYVRSGRYRYFREADTWLRHHRDVDCCFWDTPDDGARPDDNKGGNRLGGGHRHDQQHWGAYMTSYGIPSIAVAHHYYLTGDGRDLDVMKEYCQWLLHRNQYENEGVLSALYMGEALNDRKVIDEAMARDVKPGVGYGRLVYDSGMGLMLHDIHTGGDPAVRAKLAPWADIDEPDAAFIRGYLYGQGDKRHGERMKKDIAALFPAKPVRAQYFAWATRKPADFRDAFSPDIMPDGVWKLPFRTLEKLVFDAPFELGNCTSRTQVVSQLFWLMQASDGDPR